MTSGISLNNYCQLDVVRVAYAPEFMVILISVWLVDFSSLTELELSNSINYQSELTQAAFYDYRAWGYFS